MTIFLSSTEQLGIWDEPEQSQTVTQIWEPQTKKTKHRVPESASHYVVPRDYIDAPWNSVVSQIELRFGAIFEISTGHRKKKI